MLYIGCPMWGYKEWVGGFFPPRTAARDFLRLYSRRFHTVEGNTTFYALPSSETVRHWAMETPETFHFCPKISRTISHATRLDETKSETLFFVERMRGLRTRLGPIFLQLPPTFTPDQLAQLQAFLTFWPSDVRLAIEVRHPGFFAEPQTTALNTLLERHQVARVIMDTRPIQVGPPHERQLHQARERKPHLPVQITTTTDFAFVRYIGHPRMEMNDTFFDEWAAHFKQWLTQGLTLYVFCHCPFEEHSPEICTELYSRVRALVPLPPLPRPDEKLDEHLEQGRLF